MKNSYVVSLVFIVFLFTSFKVDKACEYAGSNINYVKTQTEKAIAVDNINQVRYFAYKALNGIEKSKNQLTECGCEYATENISEGLSNLKLAIKATSLNSAHILLKKALDNTLEGIESLEDHQYHDSKYGSDQLAMNTIAADNGLVSIKNIDKKEIERKIDISLEKYRESLDKIVNSVNCKEAYTFALKIFAHCEQQLLKQDLSEGKKYYNLRTKEITAAALKKLDECQ